MSDQPEINANTIPPGSTESFNGFKGRILDAVTGIQSENEGHNTVVVGHSKALGVLDAWRHAGMPEDDSIHMPTFEADNIKPGGHEEYKIPEHVMLNRSEKQPSALVPLDPDVGFDQQGRPLRYSPDDVMHFHGIIDKLAGGAVDTLSGKSPGEVPSTEEIERTPMIGMFGGKRGAQRYGDYHKLERAAKLEQADVDPRAIFRDTGVYRDEDGHQKYVMPSGLVTIRNAFNETDFDQFSLKQETGLTLKDVYHNPEFYKRYPDAKDIPLQHLPDENLTLGSMGPSEYSAGKTLGGWGPDTRTLVKTGVMSFKRGISGDELVRTVHHELQHWIQDDEGFEGGANFYEILNNNPLYQRSLASELRAATKAERAIRSLPITTSEKQDLAAAYNYAAESGIESKDIRNVASWYHHTDPIVGELAPIVKHLQTSSIKRPARLSMDSTIKDRGGSVYQTHPSIIELLRALDDTHASLSDRETAHAQAYEHYLNTSGEVEARTAEDYANIPESVKMDMREAGASPRDFMAASGWDELNRRPGMPGTYQFPNTSMVKGGKPSGYWLRGEGFQTISKMVDEGKSVTQIAEATGLSPGNAYNYIKGLGLDYNPSKENLKPRGGGSLPDEDVSNTMYDMFTNKGMSYSDIAKAFKTSRSTVAGKISRLRSKQTEQESTPRNIGVTLPKLKFLEKDFPE